MHSAGNDHDLNAGLQSLRDHHVNALLLTAAPYFDTRRARIIEFVAQNKIPAIYQFREYAVDGGLISYGPRITNPIGKRALTWVGFSMAPSRAICLYFNRRTSIS